MSSIDLERARDPQRYGQSQLPSASSLPIHLKPLGPDDVPDYCKMLMRLDRQSRCSRFGHAISDTALCEHAERAIGSEPGGVGIYVGENLRGAVELYHRGGMESCAEAAFVVAERWRRIGLGLRLLRAAVDWTAARNIGMEMFIDRQNWPMRYLAFKAGARFSLTLDMLRAEIPVAASKPDAVALGCRPAPARRSAMQTGTGT